MARRAGVLPEFSIFHEVGVTTVPSERSAHGTVVGTLTTIVSSSSADRPAPPSSAYAGTKERARHNTTTNAAAIDIAAAWHIPVIARTQRIRCGSLLLRSAGSDGPGDGCRLLGR